MERLAGRIILLWGWRRALVAFLAGALLVLVQAPYDFFAAGFISFPILVWLLDGATPDRPRGLLRRIRPALATGFSFGMGYFIAGLWWVGAAFLVDAENYAWALPIGVLLLPAIMSSYWALAAAAARFVWPDGIGRIASLAAAFAVGEWLRGWVFTGFPWNAVGYGVMPIPLLMQPVRLVGMDGMNALAVFVFALPALLADRRHVGSGLAALVLLVAAQVGFGYHSLTKDASTEGARSIDVRIVQTSVAQNERWNDENRKRDYQALLDATVAPPADDARKPTLILWPETSVPYLFTREGKAVLALSEALADGQNLIAGAVRAEPGQAENRKDAYYNSAMAVDDSGEIFDAVDKVHLVPGGEFLPLADFFASIGIDQIITGPNNFNAGTSRHSMSIGGISYATLICYEVIFGGEVWDASRDADVLVNLSNDGWFGDTPGPYQHLRQAQVRAVETGKPMLRAVNLGMSAVIDHRGRILDAFRLDASGALDATVSVPARPSQIPFNPRTGGWIVIALLAVLALALSVRQRLRVN